MTSIKFYTYRQNCTGGSFNYSKNEHGRYVFIEAKEDYLADFVAKQNGIYFDGVDKEIDCECCGDRWQQAQDYNSFESTRVLKNEIYELLSDKYHQVDEEDYDEDKPFIVIHFYDNTVVNIYPLLRTMSKEEKELKIQQILKEF